MLIAVLMAAISLVLALPAAAASVSTTTTLSLSNSSINLNDNVTMTATVKASTGTASPTGTVEFDYVDANSISHLIGTAPLAGSGIGTSTATLDFNSFPAGNYQVVAHYSGAFNAYVKSDSNGVPLSVAGAPLHNTTTQLTADPATITVGDQVTLTAHVFENDGGVIVPTGTVTFRKVAGGLLGQANLDGSGNAVLTVGDWAAGTYTVTAEYPGDAYDRASSGQLTFTVNPGRPVAVDTTTTVTADPSAVQAGAGFLLTAQIVQQTLGGQPVGAGPVTFYATPDGGIQKLLGQGNVTWTSDGVSVASGVATLQSDGLPAGHYTIEADYLGDIYDNSSAGLTQLSVTPQSPTTLSYTGDATGFVGTPANVQFQLLDANNNPVAAEPVTITVNGQDYAATTDTGGTAAALVSLPAGSYSATASFAGDDRFLASSGSGAIVVNKLSATLAYTGDTSALAGSPATVRFKLTDQSSGGALAGKTVSVTIDGQTQALTTGADGSVSFTVTKPGGTYPISATFAGDATYLGSAGSGSLNVGKIATTTVYTGATTANGGQPATLSATLTDTAGHLLSGKLVTLSFGTQSCSATTNLNGVASCQLTVTSAPGGYTVTAAFAGDASYLPSSGTGTITVAGKATTKIVDNVTGNYLVGSTATLSGTLTANGLPLAGKTINLTLGLSLCFAVTNASGVGSCTVTVPAPVGPTASSASFLGDAGTTGSVDVKTALVYALSPGGSFVVGDRSATGSVTFWGSQWAKSNSVSVGTADSSFKGFAMSPTTPQCGGTWTTDPGNSSSPPKGPLPAYMAVAVTSKTTKSGKTISGTIVHVVIVKTNSGYDANPGHAGTGTVVATIC